MKASEFDSLYRKEFERAKKYFGAPTDYVDVNYIKPGMEKRCGAQHVGYEWRGRDVIYFYFDRKPENVEYDEDIEFKQHRLDGPAYIDVETIEWFVNGKLHRADGPAVIRRGRDDEFWIKGRKWTKEKFLQHFDLKESKFQNLIKESTNLPLPDQRKIYDHFVKIYQRERAIALKIYDRATEVIGGVDGLFNYYRHGYLVMKLSDKDRRKTGADYLVTDKYHFVFSKGGSDKQYWVHRIDGPASINGSYAQWYNSDIIHRSDGPASVSAKQLPEYFINGKKWEKERYVKHFDDKDGFDG